MPLKGSQDAAAWLRGALSFWFVAWMLCSLPMVRAGFADDSEDQNDPLRTHYQRLYNYYKGIQDKGNPLDCKIKSDKSSKEDPDHSSWGTLETLEFLSGNRKMGELTIAEMLTSIPKLRKFLTRIGYLKDPGSLVFLDKQAQTLRLTGCHDGAIWRTHGEKKGDLEFQKVRHTGSKQKGQVPNGFNYIHKYTCYVASGNDKCSHTFYVITKMLPELPLGLLVREGSDAGEYGFACTYPYCRLKSCTNPGEMEPIPRRAYPPFKLAWHVPPASDGKPSPWGVKKNDPPLDQQKYSSLPNLATVEKEVKIVWANMIRANKDAEFNHADSFMEVKTEKEYDFIDGFGDMKRPDDDNKDYSLQTRIHIKIAHEKEHVGPYECVIQDANGVVSIPNMPKHEYRGKSAIYVLPSVMVYTYAVALGCILLVIILILICPKKMEHDDGSAYTNDELVAPTAEVEMSAVPSKAASTKEAKSKESVKKEES